MPASKRTERHAGIAGCIDDSIRTAPDRIAIGTADGRMRASYRQLNELVAALARKLTDAGIPGAGPIALYSDNSPEFVVALLAAWRAGAAVVPVNPQLTATEVETRLAAVKARAVVLPRRLADSYPAGAHGPGAWLVEVDAASNDVAIGKVQEGTGQPQTAARSRRACPPADADLALLMFTTGSTGTPKIVPLTHGNLSASVAGIVSAYHLGPDDATLLIMPLFHGHGLVAGLLATLASAGAAYLPITGRFSAHLFWTEIASAHATWYTAVPTVHQILLARADTEYPADRPPALRFIRSSSAPLAPAVLTRTQERFGAPVIPAYGMTETAHQAASNPLPGDGICKAASVGMATGLDIRIAAARGTPAAAGETGEVCVRGPALTSGYLGDPQATAEAFSGGWFRTGDLGHVDSDGYLFLSGRTKDMINRGGEKIAPQSVEAALLSHPAVEDALAFPASDAKYGEEVNAAVILQPGHRATQAELQQHCRGLLSAFEIPAKIYFLDRLPRTAKGDGDRRALAVSLSGD